MNHLLGETLIYAATISISPVPVIAVILMLRSSRPKMMGLGFLAGWIAGIAVAATVMTAVASVIPDSADSGDGSQPVAGIARLVLGIALLFLAVKKFRSRPKRGEVQELPEWLNRINTMGPNAAPGFGFLLAALNPKNLMMAMAAGVVFGGAHAGIGTVVGAVTTFTVLAGLSVLVPVVLYLLAPVKILGVLESIMEWLMSNSNTIVMVVLTVLGTQIIGQGIDSF
ncbi:hypothetical protein CQ018_04945 [Arthrobacter sp. MYb227]|uniref:GAP family protein n=1 Tax=Arthrobacter sp. MYb227 TaxID=1848601 RepID=UPI000CFD6181|nr:GAP family protein [Arthrobacter sp. MYb227]PQZ94697.1 hypothetical protein CQ018_04945 [Arthrobacter sp. MYb227]